MRIGPESPSRWEKADADPPAKSHQARIDYLNSSDVYTDLPYDQKLKLKKALGLDAVDLELHKLRAKDYHGYLASVQGRGMTHLLDTLLGHNRYLADIKEHYETCCMERFGVRPEVATVTSPPFTRGT